MFRFRTQEKEQCTYLQIDGEFFKTVNPQCVTVRLSSLFEPPRVRVLRKGEGL